MKARCPYDLAAVMPLIHSYNVAVLESATRTSGRDGFHPDQQRMEELRFPVERPDFKSGRGCQQSLVGSTPTLFRHPYFPPAQ
jgi:hypothetical protein